MKLPLGLAAILYALSLLLNAPLFFRDELPYRNSIEPGYAATTRLIAEHPNPWGWNPTQYTGLPTQHTYLPALPYAGAVVSWLPFGIAPDRAYRLVSSALACAVPVSFFALFYFFTRSPWWSLIAALCIVFFSPSYGLFDLIDRDRGLFYLPWRLQVLVKYGEGPHNAGLAILPFALIAIWQAATRRGFRWTFAAAALCALIALTNWISALTLGICYLLVLLCAWRRDVAVGPLLAIPVLAWLLAAFWLTPSYVRTTMFNWPEDAFGYVPQRSLPYVAAALILTLVVIRWLFHRFHDDFPLCYSTMAAVAFGTLAICYYSWRVDLLPESRRYLIEAELMFFVAMTAWLRAAWRSPRGIRKVFAAVCVTFLVPAGLPQLVAYSTQGWGAWKLVPRSQMPEYRLAAWLDAQKPGGRVFATGGLRFRMNSIYPIAQAGGTFETGLRNRVPLRWAYQIRTGVDSKPEDEKNDAVVQLTMLGVEYAVVHGEESGEYYRDFRKLDKLDGTAPEVFRDGGDRIYRYPFRSLAHVVKPEELPNDWPRGSLNALYGAAIDPARPAVRAEWDGNSAMNLSGRIDEGRRIIVFVGYDDGWVAIQNCRPLSVDRNATGYMVITPQPDEDARIRLEYRGGWEQRLCSLLSVGTWALCLLKIRRR